MLKPGSPILDKQVTKSIIVGDGVGLWGGLFNLLPAFILYFICIQENQQLMQMIK